MPPREWKLRIEDILECIGRIQEYTRGLTADAFAADQKTIDAVVRNFEIIGEATRHVPPHIQTQYPEIPWAMMRAFRNVMIHAYEIVDVDVVWKTSQERIEPLVPHLRRILAENA